MPINTEPTGPNLGAMERANYIEQQVAAEEKAEQEEQQAALQDLITEAGDAVADIDETLNKFGTKEERETYTKPRLEKDPKDYSLSDTADEYSAAIQKGAIGAIDSILTLPERLYDAARGQDIDPSKGYTPDWDPLKNVEDPIVRTWWGKFTEGVVHYGTLGVPAAAVAGVAGVPAAGGLATTGLVAATSTYTDGDSLSAEIVEKAPFMDVVLGPFATKDTDHPLFKKFKNILEEMYLEKGLDTLIGVIWNRAGNLPKGDEVAAARKANVDAQIKEAGQQELVEERILSIDRQLGGETVDVDVVPDKPDITGTTTAGALPEGTTPKPKQPTTEFRGHKNKPFADPWQGSPTSTAPPAEIHRQLNQIDTDPSAKGGSTDSPLTAAQLHRMSTENGMPIEELEKMGKELFTDARLQEIKAEAKAANKSFREYFEPAYQRYKEMMGRNWQEMSADEFWGPLEALSKDKLSGYEIWAAGENLLAADLVNSALFKNLRDHALAAREINNFGDVFAVDGPMKKIADKLVIGLGNVKKSRYLWGVMGRKMRKGMTVSDADVAKRLADIHGETKASVELMNKFMKESESKELANGILEIFSQADEIQTWMDLDAYMRKLLRGGEIKGKTRTGQIIRDMQGILIHSRLSSPKTPQRALWGTGYNAYLTQFETLLGAGIRAGRTGDARAARIQLAKFKRMAEVLPEAWDTMISKMNSYFSSDVTTIKNRYSTRNHKDFDWKVYDAWTEQRGNFSDKLASGFAHILDKIQMSNIAGWSSRALAAADDAHAVIQSRARARELAFIDALEKEARNEISEVTPEVLQKAEKHYYSKLLDENGDIDTTKDAFLDYQFKESTLMNGLGDRLETLQSAFNRFPQLVPFFNFIRPSINDFILDTKRMPGIQLLHKEMRSVFMAKPDNIKDLAKYGITNVDELRNAQQMWQGRLITGTIFTKLFVDKYLAGELSGDGPADTTIRKSWEDAGWQRNKMWFGDLGVNVDLLEPFNTLGKAVADIGDNMYLMGPEWADQRLQTIPLIVAGSITNKSMMTGLNQMVDVFKMRPGQLEKIVGGIANDFVPLAGARNALGRTINPYMRELGNDITDTVRNRNLSSEYLAKDPLPKKWNIINGDPAGSRYPLLRMLDAVTPFAVTTGNTKAVWLLKQSNYDERTSTLSAPSFNGIRLSLRDENEVRSKFQKAIGDSRVNGKSLEDRLIALSKKKQTINSINTMHTDMRQGNFGKDPGKAYWHNKQIKQLFEEHRQLGWSSIINDPEIQALYEEAISIKQDEATTLQSTSEFIEQHTDPRRNH